MVRNVANTGVQRNVEDWVRIHTMAQVFRQPLENKALRLTPGRIL